MFFHISLYAAPNRIETQVSKVLDIGRDHGRVYAIETLSKRGKDRNWKGEGETWMAWKDIPRPAPTHVRRAIGLGVSPSDLRPSFAPSGPCGSCSPGQRRPRSSVLCFPRSTLPPTISLAN